MFKSKKLISLSAILLLTGNILNADPLPTCTQVNDSSNYSEYKTAYQSDGIPVSINLQKGWNLVSFTGLDNPDLQSLFAGYSQIHTIFKYNSSTSIWEKINKYDYSTNDLTLNSSEGVWIYTTNSVDINCIKANSLNTDVESYITKVFSDSETVLTEKTNKISKLETLIATKDDQISLLTNTEQTNDSIDVENYTFISSVTGNDSLIIPNTNGAYESSLFLTIGIPSEYSDNKHLQLAPTISISEENASLSEYVSIEYVDGILPFRYKTGESISTEIKMTFDKEKFENNFPSDSVVFPIKVSLNNGNPNSVMVKNVTLSPSTPPIYEIEYYNGPLETKVISGDGENVNLKYKVTVTNKENITSDSVYARVSLSATNIDPNTMSSIPDTIELESGGTDYKILPLDINFARNLSLNQNGALTITLRVDDEESNSLVQTWTQNPKTPDPRYDILLSTSSIGLSSENVAFTLTGEANIVETGGYIAEESVEEQVRVSIISGKEYLSSGFDEETKSLTVYKTINEEQITLGKGNFVFPYSFDSINDTGSTKTIIMKIEIPGKTETSPGSLLYTITQDPAEAN